MKRLIAVQQQLRSRKDKAGDGGRFAYRSAEDILENVKPLLAEQHLAVTLSDNLVQLGDRIFLEATATLWGEERDLMEVKALAELDFHIARVFNKDTKEWREVKTMSNEQCTGSASSYARKYALCGLFAIDDSDQDPDGAKSLTTRIAEATNEDDINALMPEMKNASEDEKKAFNAQTKHLGLEYDKGAKKYVKQQNQ